MDDSASIRHALHQFLDCEPDWEVCGEAENGRAAVEKAQQLHPHLIVMDLSMPVMNGLDAARVLKRLMPAVPVVIYTGVADGWTKQHAQREGVAEVVSKSEQVSVLVEKIRGLLMKTAGRSENTSPPDAPGTERVVRSV